MIGPSGCGEHAARCQPDERPDRRARTRREIQFDGETSPLIPTRPQASAWLSEAEPLSEKHLPERRLARINGYRGEMDELVERFAPPPLWDGSRTSWTVEASGSPAASNTLCIARTLAVEPEVILMDGFVSARPISTARSKTSWTTSDEYHRDRHPQHAAGAGQRHDRVPDARRIRRRPARTGVIAEFSATDLLFTNPRIHAPGLHHRRIGLSAPWEEAIIWNQVTVCLATHVIRPAGLARPTEQLRVTTP